MRAVQRGSVDRVELMQDTRAMVGRSASAVSKFVCDKLSFLSTFESQVVTHLTLLLLLG